MAKKDDIDLDNLDLDDFDFDIPEWKDSNEVDDKSRSPIDRVTRGTLQGVKDELASKSGLRKALMLALPSGYGLAADTIDNVATDARSLYDKVTSDQPDLVRGSKGFGRKAMQSVGNRILPKKIADRLNNALEEDEDYQVKSSSDYKREQEESDLAAIAEIFKAQGAADQERSKQEEVDKLETKALEQARFKSNIQALTSINRSMARLVGYQDKVTARYQQKMLELNYRQLATTKQLSDLMAESMAKHTQILEKIRHNTALPEAVKIRGSEMFHQLAKERLMGSGLNTISNWSANYGKQVMNNVTGMLQGIIDPIRDASSMTEGMDIDKYEMGGRVTGSMIGSQIRDYAAIHIAPLLSRNKTIARTGEKLRGAFTGLPQRINEYAQSKTEGAGWRSTMTQMFKDFLPKYQLEQGTGGTAVDQLDEMGTFDKIARRSLIEIIPGYLSEIAHWSRVAVTGEKDSDKRVYNIVRGGFTTEKEQLADVGRQILNRSERDSLRNAANDFLKEIGGDTMSERAQRVLKQKLLNELANGRDLKPERLADPSEYPNEDVAVVDEITSLIIDTFNLDYNGKMTDTSVEGKSRFNNIREKFLNMASMIPAAGDRIRILGDVLGMDSLRKLGFIERNENSRQDNINFNKIWSTFLDEDDQDSKGRDPQDPAPHDHLSRRRGDGADGSPKGGDSLTDRAARADRVASHGEQGRFRVGGLEKYLGDKSTLITLVRESRDFHSETVELLKHLTNCSCNGVGGSSGSFRDRIDWDAVSAKLKSSRDRMTTWSGDTIKKGRDRAEELKKLAQDIWVQGEDHPRLVEWRLKAGEYKDKLTGETLKRWEDIRGDVVDQYNKVVIRYDELMESAVVTDAKGRVRKTAAELLSRFKVSRAGIQTKKAIDFVQEKSAIASKEFSKEKRKFRPRIKRLMNFFTGGKADADVSSELTGDHEQDMLTLALRSVQLQYETLKQVTTEKVRKGSYQDLWSRRKDLMENAKGTAKSKYEDVKGLFGKGGLLAGLLDRYGDRGEGDDEGGGDGDTYIDMGDQVDDEKRRRNRNKTKTPNGKPRGKFGRAWDATKRFGGRMLDKTGMFGKGVRLGGRILGGVTRGAWGLAKGATRLGWSALKIGGRILGSQAVRTGAMFLGRMALGAVLGAAGLVSAPVLAVAGVALAAIAIGGAIYSMTRDELPPLTRIRMVQYGVKPNPEKDEVKQLMELEKLFAAHTSVDSEGRAKVDHQSVKVEDIAQIFKINLDTPAEENELFRRTMSYVSGRFAAVYLTHISNYFALTKSTDLTQIDSKVTGKAALEFVDKVAMKDRQDVFNAMTGPFDDDELDMDGDDVEDVLEEAKELIKEAMEKSSSSKSASEQHADALKASAAAGAAAGVASGVVPTASSKAKAADLASSGLHGTGAGKATTSNVASSLKTAAVATGGAGATVVAVAAANMEHRSTELDDGKPVRYRVYGLTEMAESKVAQVAQLENFCWSLVQYDNHGRAYLKDEALAHAEAEKIFAPIGKEVEDVYVWFYRRFLPVFLAYCTGVRARSNIDARDAATRLKPQELLEILKGLASVKDNADIPVWDITQSPWSGYYLNDEPESVKDALYALSLKVKDKTLTEPSGHSNGRVRGKDGNFIDEDPTQVNKPASASNPSSGATAGSGNESGGKEEKGFFSGLWDSTKSFFGADSKTPQQGSVNAQGQSVAAGATSFTSGTPISHPGGGSGGNINDIPEPKGDGWENNRDTLMAAANMVGVDPTLAASVAGVESGYRPNVKAPTSSAAGYYQVINDTWKYLMGKYAGKYGINPNTRQTDPRANALLGLEYIRENVDIVKGAVKRGVTDTDVYLAHFLGPGGAKRFLAAPPGDSALNHVTAKQADANRAIFFDRSGRPRTVAAVYNDFDGKLKKYRQSDAMQVAMAFKGGPAPSATTTDSDQAVAAVSVDTEMPSMVKPTSPAQTGTTSTNTVADASSSPETSNLSEKADARQVQNSTAGLTMVARTAEAQSSTQAKASSGVSEGFDKGMNRLIGVNESQLEQLITLVNLLKEGTLQMPATSGPAAELVAEAKPTTQNPNIDRPMPARKAPVSTGRA